MTAISESPPHALAEIPEQLDLFVDSAFNSTLRRVCDALGRADAAVAAQALTQAGALAEVGSEGVLHSLAALLDVLLEPATLLRDPEQGLRRLREDIGPLAERLLGRAAAGYRTALLRRLAQAMDVRGFVNGRDLVHPAELWLQLGQPDAALASVTADLFWRGCGRRLGLFARINEQLGATGFALEAWCELCWLFPDRAETELPVSALLAAEWLDFSDLEPPLATEWFPVWVALTGAALLPTPSAAIQLPGVELLRRVQQTARPARQTIEFRQALREASPGLLAHLLAHQRAN